MKVVAKYDFNGCQAAIQNKYSKEYDQIVSVIDSIDSALFSPMEINKAFEVEHNRFPFIHGRETMGWLVAWIKHLHNRRVTVHGLDFGIPAEMTDFPVWLDLCITMRYPSWERSL